MDRSEAEASLRVLVALARADGRVTSEEERVITLAGEHEGRSLGPLSVGEVDLEAELARLKSKEARRFTLKSALAIATVDGETSVAEEAMLRRIHAALGDDAVLELRVIESAAADRMKDLRSALDATSDEFMHALARATETATGKVDPREYERLLGGLEARKREILEQAIDQRVSVAPGS